MYSDRARLDRWTERWMSSVDSWGVYPDFRKEGRDAWYELVVIRSTRVLSYWTDLRLVVRTCTGF